MSAPGSVRFTRGVLRALEWIANPALAGAAFCLLALGVVTWLPALAATAYALRGWREGDDQRCFTATLAAFAGYWRSLWRHALLSTAGAALLVINLAFLAGQPSPLAFALLAAQVGLGAAAVVYHFALAAVAAQHSPGADARGWRRQAAVLGFGSPLRGLALLGTLLAVCVATLPLVAGPLLFGPTVPLILALAFARRVLADPAPEGRD
jgi:uncharacterized membrane protein YesL